MISRYHRPHEMYKDAAKGKLQSSECGDNQETVTPPSPSPPPAFPPPPDVTKPPSGSSSASDMDPSGKALNSATLPAGEAFGKNGDMDFPKRRQSRSKTKAELARVMGGFYAQLLVVASAVMTFTEVLTNDIPLFFYHGYLYTYIVGGAIICLLAIYVTMVVDRFPRLTGANHSQNNDEDLSPFKTKTSYYSSDIYIYLRIGTVVFGLGTLVSTGLEIGTIFTIKEHCMNELNLVQPFLRGLFAFIQMHFLFMNSQELLQSLGWFRHLALMHLMATNIAVWIRLIFFETALYWLQSTHFPHNATLGFPINSGAQQRHFNYLLPNISQHTLDKKGGHLARWATNCWWREYQEDQMEDVLTVYYCLRNTTIGDIWEKSLPYLSPCIVQYSLLAAAITYYLWENIDVQRPSRKSLCSSVDYDASRVIKRRKSLGNLSFDCHGSTKGLFLGLLTLAAGIIVLILFFVLAHEKKFRSDTLIAMVAMHCTVLIISVLATGFGLFQIHRVRTRSRKPQELHSLLQSVGILAVYSFGLLNMIVGGSDIGSAGYLILFLDGAFMIIQGCTQSVFVHQIGRKGCSANSEFSRSKPGRQVVTFLVFANMVLWLMESFVTQDQLVTELQIGFYGDLPWGVLSRVALPLVVFYRFHSSALLMESWKKSYKITED